MRKGPPVLPAFPALRCPHSKRRTSESKRRFAPVSSALPRAASGIGIEKPPPRPARMTNGFASSTRGTRRAEASPRRPIVPARPAVRCISRIEIDGSNFEKGTSGIDPPANSAAGRSIGARRLGGFKPPEHAIDARWSRGRRAAKRPLPARLRRSDCAVRTENVGLPSALATWRRIEPARMTNGFASSRRGARPLDPQRRAARPGARPGAL